MFEYLKHCNEDRLLAQVLNLQQQTATVSEMPHASNLP